MRKTYEMVQCVDGFTVSIQASATHYCEPRSNAVSVYESVELGFPSKPCAFIKDYAEDPENLTGTRSESVV